MATAAHAYCTPAYEPSVPQRHTSPRVRVVPGTRRAPEVYPGLRRALLVCVALVSLLVCIACIRVAITAATVQTQIAQQDMHAEVKLLRSDSAALEVQKSMLSSTTVIKEKAASLGLVDASAPETLTLKPDVVSYNAQGDLSLSATLAAISHQS